MMTNRTLLFKDIIPVITNRILFIILHSDGKILEFGNADIINGKAKGYENYIVKDIECVGVSELHVWLGEEYKEIEPSDDIEWSDELIMQECF